MRKRPQQKYKLAKKQSSTSDQTLKRNMKPLHHVFWAKMNFTEQIDPYLEFEGFLQVMIIDQSMNEVMQRRQMKIQEPGIDPRTTHVQVPSNQFKCEDM